MHFQKASDVILPDFTRNSNFVPVALHDACAPSERPLTYSDLHPRVQLWLHQGMRCALGGSDIPHNAHCLRDEDGARISALVCRSCVMRPQALTSLPVLSAPALLRLRLTQGPPFAFTRLVSEDDRSALARGAWDHFVHPFHALWTQQDGKCAVYDEATHGSVTEASARFLVADYDPEDSKVDGLICKQCQPQESKAVGTAAEVWRWYRSALPGRACPATRGLTRAVLLDWNRDRYSRRRWNALGDGSVA